MAKIILLTGLPASGKSTKARQLSEQYGNFVRLNKDLLRTMLHFDKWNGNNEKITAQTEVALARKFLAENQSIIVDDTNLSQSSVDRWHNIAREFNATFEHIKLETPIEECIERDYSRQMKCEHYVGKDVIMKMAMQYGMYKPKVGYLICDLDGTVADLEHRLKYAKGVDKNWATFYSLLMGDKPRQEIIDAVYKRVVEDGLDLVFVSGRPIDHEAETKKWLKENASKIYDISTALIMRGFSDKREDTLVKRDILNDYFQKDLVKVIYDDRPSVLRMWKAELPNAEIIDVGQGIEF